VTAGRLLLISALRWGTRKGARPSPARDSEGNRRGWKHHGDERTGMERIHRSHRFAAFHPVGHSLSPSKEGGSTPQGRWNTNSAPPAPPNHRLSVARRRIREFPSRLGFGHEQPLAKSSSGLCSARKTASPGDTSSGAHPIVPSSSTPRYPPSPPFPRPNATAAVACVGNSNTVHTFCIRPIASLLAHSRSPMTQLFRFIRPAR